MKKYLGIFVLVAAAIGFLFASGNGQALVNVVRTLQHYWFAGDNQLRFGATPNATISYTGGNLVLDVTSGGGKVSIPDGVDLGTNGLNLASSLVFEGATADAFETTISVVDPTTPDKTVTIPNQTGAVILSVGGVADSASAISGGTGTFVFEGATADAFETTLAVTDPTADQTWTIPNFAVSAAFLGSTLTTNNIDAANSVWGVSNGLAFEGATANAFELTVASADVTADQTLTLPDGTGTVVITGKTNCTSVLAAEINPTEASATDDYINLVDNTASATETDENAFMVPVAMIAHSLRVEVNVAPGVGNDPWAVTLRDDVANTTLTCTIDEANTSCTDSTNAPAIAAGSKLAVLVSSAGGDSDPTAASALTVSFCLGQ